MFPQLTYANHSAAIIDNFPERMERFLDCISEVYFQQESFDAIITSKDKAVGKNLMAKMALKEGKSAENGHKQQQKSSLPTKVMPGVYNWDYPPATFVNACTLPHCVVRAAPLSCIVVYLSLYLKYVVQFWKM